MKGTFFLFSVAAGWPLLLRSASAQNAPIILPAPGAAPVARPATNARGINVLIIALDDATTVPQDTATVTSPPLTRNLPAAPPLVPDVPLVAITPTTFEGLRPEWRAFAKKKKDDQPFLPVPESPSKAPLLSRDGKSVTAPTPRLDTPTTQGPTPQDPTPDSVPAPFVPIPSRSILPAGRAMLAAVPLARTLSGQGYTDVQTTAPDGNLILRAVGDRRLAPGTIDALRQALISLQSATKLPEGLRKASINVATKRATDAAVAIGQATGYRAVVALYVSPFTEGASPYSVVLGDSSLETGEPILWSETAKDEATARDTGAATGAALLDKSLDQWAPVVASSVRSLADLHLGKARTAAAAGDLNAARDEITRATALDATRTDTSVLLRSLADLHLGKARTAAAAGDLNAARDEIAQAIALDATSADAYTLLGDLLAPTDLTGSATAYRRALQLNAKQGTTYEKLAIAYANAPVPDWTRTLEAGQKALAAGTDTANLRIAMARAQFGRADLFRAGNGAYAYKADDAEAAAQTHLDRALQLSPDNPDVLRLLARSLIAGGRTTEAVQTLDRVLPLFPKDIDLQRQYAEALISLGDRKEDSFVAYSKLWKLSANTTPSVDAISYSALVQGFDEHVYNLGKSARLLSDGFLNGSIGRESAFLQLSRLKSDMSDAEDAITTLQVPAGFSTTASTTRQFAATLMTQSLEAHQTFLDTGQVLYRTRAAEFYRQSVAQLNAARNAK